ncbi:pantoate--beta-alanine ligase [Pararhodospirillum photometricum]|uniref:Pantothenate synthetase n=1 Tax=Pararhodospirillum photometricum DSM 122 TaxID=1150469 RepID=H6SSK9_PARPM|nr:pantoate--beta-alanine ligase [Pararhodospirillum photometricum]CCG07888.1 Pantothenate synthetase [Pararhodospirillum photometricum DSM 122]
MSASAVSFQPPFSLVRDVAVLRQNVAAWRAAGLRVALVPTMGALHDGHLSLVRLGLAHADRVVVSLFVNPTQFGPAEDFAAYPRQEGEDAAALRTAGAHLLYAPDVAGMYPEGFATTVSVAGVSEGLCGDHRPGHFQGVATVVTKLLLRVLPDVALFGEKDYQQVQVIRRVVTDLDIPVKIVAGPTVREADGLALSSRNAYLSPAERAVAPTLHRVLQEAAAALRAGEAAALVLERARSALSAAGFGPLDYLDLRDAETLVPLASLGSRRAARLLVAVKLGRTRLIDNIPVLADAP